MTTNIANIPNADEQFLKSLTVDIDQIEKNKKELEDLSEEYMDDEFKPDDVFKYIVKKSKKLISQTEEVAEKMGDTIQVIPDPELLKSYSGLIQSMAGIIRNMTDVAASKEKSNSAIKIKEMDIEAKKELKELDRSIEETRIEDTGPLTIRMTREEVMNAYIKTLKNAEPEEIKKPDKKKKEKIIDI